MFQLIKWQIKKLLIYNGGVCLLLVYAAILLFLQALPSDMTESPALQRSLAEYYQEYGGKLTEQTVSRIEAHYQDIQTADAQWNAALTDMQNGSISQEEFQAIQASVSSLRREQRAFEKFYLRYQYCAEDPDNRYLVDTQGWKDWMDAVNPDYLMLLFAAVLAAIMDKSDVGTNLEPLQKATRLGGLASLISRWVAVFAACVLLLVLTVGIQGWSIAREASFCSGNVPLQSISQFARSTYDFTIWQAFLLGNGIRLLGLGYCAILTVCCSQLAGNVMLGCFCGIGAGLLPGFAFREDFLYLTLPLPTGFVQGFSYLYGVGTMAMQSLDTLGKISCGAILILSGVTAAVLLRGHRWRRRIRPAILILATVILLSGCAEEECVCIPSSQMDSVYLVETEDYIVYDGESALYVQEKATLTERLLLDDPLEPDDANACVSYVRAWGNTLYFLYSSGASGTTVQSIDLDTGQRETLFKEMDFGSTFTVFDVPLWQAPSMNYEQMCNQVRNFLIVNGDLILLRGESITLWKNGWESILYEGYYSYAATDGMDVYFCNNDGILCKLSETDEGYIVYPNILPAKLKACDGCVWYLDAQNGSALTVLDSQTGQWDVLVSGEWTDFQQAGAHILLRDAQGALWITEADSIQLRLVCEKADYTGYLLRNDGSILLVKEGSLASIPLDSIPAA